MKNHRANQSGAGANRCASASQNDWVHCNGCYQMPASNKQMTFFFTSCGHIICDRCTKKNLDSQSPSVTDTCRACKRRTTFMEVNRNLGRDYLLYFRNLREMINEFAKNMTTVLEFQHYHRSRLQRHREEDHSRYVKYAKAAQSELLKLKEKTRNLFVERDKYKEEAEKQRQRADNLENTVSDLKEELERMKRMSRKREFVAPTQPAAASMPRPKHYSMTPNLHGKRVHPHLNGSTPIHTLSMIGMPMSTPIDQGINVFNKNNVSLHMEESPIVASGGILSTPALLGLDNPPPSRVHSSGVRGSSFFRL